MRADCAFGAVWSDQRLSAVVEGAEAPRDGGPRVIDVATDGLLRCGEQVLVGLGSAGEFGAAVRVGASAAEGSRLERVAASCSVK